jgi:hypothetical protein
MTCQEGDCSFSIWLCLAGRGEIPLFPSDIAASKMPLYGRHARVNERGLTEETRGGEDRSGGMSSIELGVSRSAPNRGRTYQDIFHKYLLSKHL